ncbi:hypothetical protein JCM10213_000255 [Rhodosporidiobolus nylandii]
MLDPQIKKELQNADYDRRKRAALGLEPFLRDLASAHTQDSELELKLVIEDLVEMCGTRTGNAGTTTAIRSGGAMGLASLAIALDRRLPDFLGAIVLPIFACFEDHDAKLRYYACESLYNVAKAASGEILVYFNEMFDILSKLCTETEASVKNGAELLDRQIKDTATEWAAVHVTLANHGAGAFGHDYSPTFGTHRQDQGRGPGRSEDEGTSTPPEPQRAFSLPRFIPLLRERMTVLSPFTRTFLISWLNTLASVPELELVSYLPDFLEGLLRYLADPTPEVQMAADGLLERLLREIKEIREIEIQRLQVKREAWERDVDRRRRRASEARTVTDSTAQDEAAEGPARDGDGEGTPIPHARRSSADDGEDEQDVDEEALATSDEDSYDDEYEDDGEWAPGQGVHIDYAAILEILVRHLSFPDQEIQATCLHWLSEFLQFVPGVLVPYAPRLIPVILSALAHPTLHIQQAAAETNDFLFSVVQALPVDSGAHSALSPPSTAELSPPQPALPAASPPSSIPFPSSSTATPRPGHDRHKPGSDASTSLSQLHHQSSVSTLPSIASTTASTSFASPLHDDPHAHSHQHGASEGERRGQLAYPPDLRDEHEADGARFQYGATVNELTLQFLSENEETRVAALEWLLMLHQKAPRKVLAGDDISFPSASRGGRAPATLSAIDPSTARPRPRNASASSSSSGLSIALLLKMLSDPSERVLRYDLQLLAQISSEPSAEDEYFPELLRSILELFSTDRKLLETRGSLIIRQLSGNLGAERIYRTFAEILERDEDLEFASIMVQNLSLILITSPEFADFRKRLRTLDSKDGQNLFVTLYRSWAHNAVATFTLCLLAQAYEQACALLQIFADLEMTVSLLVQIDKLVQLLESPVFTSLRLQLLEPDRHPYLLKAMYGLLMLLPQSSAFATLRNRLSAVSSLGFLGTVSRTAYTSPTAIRPGSTLASPAGSSASLAGRRNTDGGGGGSTPDPPSIRWSDLLTHFRGVQKRRAAVAGGGASTGAAGGGGDGQVRSTISPRSSNAFANGQAVAAGEDGASTIAGTTSTFGSRIVGSGGGAAGAVAGPKKRVPPFLQQPQTSSGAGSLLGTTRGGTGAGASGTEGQISSASSVFGGRAGAPAAAVRPAGGSGFVPGPGAVAQRALSPTLLAAKRRVGSAPPAATGAGTGGGGATGGGGSGFGGTAPRFA